MQFFCPTLLFFYHKKMRFKLRKIGICSTYTVCILHKIFLFIFFSLLFSFSINKHGLSVYKNNVNIRFIRYLNAIIRYILLTRKKYFYFIWFTIPFVIHGTKIVFFGVCGYFGFFKDFGHFWFWKILVMTKSMLLNSKFKLIKFTNKQTNFIFLCFAY